MAKVARDDASTSTFGLLGALTIVAMTLAVAYPMTAPLPIGQIEDDSLQTEASLLVARVAAPAAGADWTTDPDSLASFGLARVDRPARLDARALDLLARGGMEPAPNGAPDYADVKAALGYEGDFRLHVAPISPKRSDEDWAPLDIRVAYFGHYSGARAPVAATTDLLSAPDALNVTTNVTNRATTAAIFSVNVALGDAATGKALVSRDRHTTLLAPGETQTVWVRIPALSAWSSKANAIRVSITDSFGNPATDAAGNLLPSPWTSVTMPRASPAPHALVLQAANPYYVSGADVNFEIDAHDGSGNHVGPATTRISLTGPDGREWRNETIAVDKLPRATTWTCPNCTTVGNYTARLLEDSGRTIALDRIHVSEARMFTEKRTPDAVATAEIAMLDSLVKDFDPSRFQAATTMGDVFGDDVNGPTELPAVLSRYDIVVIGSEASHHALSPADVKRSITSWIEAGGALIVLGTLQEPSRWLQSEYQLSLGHAPGTPVAPSPSHALLQQPETLDVGRYPYHARAWQLPPGDDFEHVLTLGAAPDGGARDALAVSGPGRFGDGTILLTSYLPGAFAAPLGADEGTKLLHNLLARATGVPDFEFGRPIPQNTPVAAVTRLFPVSAHGDGPATVVRLTVYAFRG